MDGVKKKNQNKPTYVCTQWGLLRWLGSEGDQEERTIIRARQQVETIIVGRVQASTSSTEGTATEATTAIQQATTPTTAVQQATTPTTPRLLTVVQRLRRRLDDYSDVTRPRWRTHIHKHANTLTFWVFFDIELTVFELREHRIFSPLPLYYLLPPSDVYKINDLCIEDLYTGAHTI